MKPGNRFHFSNRKIVSQNSDYKFPVLENSRNPAKKPVEYPVARSREFNLLTRTVK